MTAKFTRPGSFAAGWNARRDDVPFDKHETVDWRDGWQRCDRVPASERRKFNTGVIFARYKTPQRWTA